MSVRVTLASLALVPLVGCTPEPASTVEMRQTVVEVVDQGRAMAIEDAMAALFGVVDQEDDELASIADAVAATVTTSLPCATVERPSDEALAVEFGAPGAPCDHEGIAYSGSLHVEYSRPSAGTLLVTLNYEPLTGDATVLDGFSQLTWGDDGSQRLVTEIRIDAVTERQVEIQSDRLLYRSGGSLKVDGWRRWQTLMGRWEADLASLVFADSAWFPVGGLAAVETPFSHTIVLDFVRDGSTPQVRVNGGRRDRLFEVTPEGEVIDRGDG